MKQDINTLPGRTVLWTESIPGKETRRVIDIIDTVSGTTITLRQNKDVKFFLNGMKQGVTRSIISRIDLIDETYAHLMQEKWTEDNKKLKIVNYLLENKNLLVILPLEMLENIETEFNKRKQNTRLV